jgi:ribosome maturation factor RimP
LRYKSGDKDDLLASLTPLAEGLGLSIVELVVLHRKGSIDVKACVFKRGGVGISDCTKFHRSIIARLELAFPDTAVYIEVSSPGINRLIKEGEEFRHFVGMPVKCWLTELSDWKAGILEEVSESYIIIRGSAGMEKLDYEGIAKAKLDSKAAA